MMKKEAPEMAAMAPAQMKPIMIRSEPNESNHAYPRPKKTPKKPDINTIHSGLNAAYLNEILSQRKWGEEKGRRQRVPIEKHNGFGFEPNENPDPNVIEQRQEEEPPPPIVALPNRSLAKTIGKGDELNRGEGQHTARKNGPLDESNAIAKATSEHGDHSGPRFL